MKTNHKQFSLVTLDKNQLKSVVGGCYPPEDESPVKDIHEPGPVKSIIEIIKELLIIH
jgi:hypothetical protein